MVAFEVGIAILNHIADWHLVLLNNCGHWPPFEKPAEWAAQVLAFPAGLLKGMARLKTQSARLLAASRDAPRNIAFAPTAVARSTSVKRLSRHSACAKITIFALLEPSTRAAAMAAAAAPGS
jgi:hypothetical protein